MSETKMDQAQAAAALAVTVLPAFLSVMDKIADLIARVHASHAKPEPPAAA